MGELEKWDDVPLLVLVHGTGSQQRDEDDLYLLDLVAHLLVATGDYVRAEANPEPKAGP